MSNYNQLIREQKAKCTNCWDIGCHDKIKLEKEYDRYRPIKHQCYSCWATKCSKWCCEWWPHSNQSENSFFKTIRDILIVILITYFIYVLGN